MVEQVEKVLGANPLVMVLPIGKESELSGVVDLLTKKHGFGMILENQKIMRLLISQIWLIRLNGAKNWSKLRRAR